MKNNIIVSFILLIVISIFLFCGKTTETFVSNCSEKNKEICTELGKICMNGKCKTQVCTPLKRVKCEAYGGICKETIGCAFKKKGIKMYNVGKGFTGTTIERTGINNYNKRVDVRNLVTKYD